MFEPFWTLVSKLNQNLKLSKPSTIIIEILSSFQIFHLIVLTLLHFATRDHVIILALAKSIRFLTGGFTFDQDHKFPIILHVIWYICASYLALCLGLLILLCVFSFIRINLNLTLIKALSLIYIIHSRVLFYPIQFFLFTLIRLYNDECKENKHFYCHIGWFIGTIALSTLNFLLALIKEFVLYQKDKTRDFYAAKTNFYHQVILIYKTLILALLFLKQNTDVTIITSSVLHLVFNCSLLYILYTKLPFYRFEILKITVIMSSIGFCLSIANILQACIENKELRNIIQFLLILLPPLGIKIALSIFKDLFERILGNNAPSIEYTIHFCLLLKQLMLKDMESFLSNKSFFPDIKNFSGALHYKEINYFNLQNSAENKKDKLLLYECMIEKLENCLKRHTNSEILIIFLAKIYLKKFENTTKPLELLKKLETRKFSIHMRSSIELLNNLFKKIRQNDISLEENRLNLDVFFRYKELTVALKSKIKCEIQGHLEFWKSFQSSSVDVRTTANKVEEIDSVFIRIDKQFQRDYPDFQANFQFPILMYSVYLNNVRHLPYEASQLLRKFQVLVLNHVPNYATNIDSDTTTVIVISLEPTRAGQIIDVTESMQNIFELKKKDVIGVNFGCFFPTAIAQGFQQIISKYIKDPSQQLDKTYKTYGKTAKGEIFDIQVHFQLHSHFGRDARAAIIIKRLSLPKPLIIIDYDGFITDYSKDIQDILHKENVNPRAFRKLQEISYEFEKVNKAFNEIYGNNIRESYRTSFGITLTNLDHERKLQTTEIEDTQKFNSGATIETNNEIGLFSSYRDDDALILNSGKKDSHRTLVQSYLGKNSPSRGFFSSAIISPKKTRKNEIPNEVSHRICEHFMKGKKLVLFPTSSTPLKKGYRLKADVQIKPYILDNSLYKIVNIKNMKREKTKLKQDEVDSSSADSHFADDFPLEKERETNTKISSSKINLMPVVTTTGDNYVTSLVMNEKTRITRLDSEKDSSLKEIIETRTETQNNFLLKNKVHIDDQKSSVMDYTFKESRFIKTLKDISTGKKLLPMLKLAIICIFIVLLFIISLSATSFFLSRKSIYEVEKGVEIVNYATECLINTEKSWGWTLFLYARAIGVGLFDDETIGILRDAVHYDILVLASASTILKNLLSSLDAGGFLQDAFAKDIQMYNPFGNDPSHRDVYNIFTATDVLIPKYLSMISYSYVEELALREDLKYNLNNTSNDYMLKSKNLITDTELFLQKIISKNLTNLRIVLIAQSVALFFLSVFLITMSVVVMKSYKKLFQVLMKIRDESVSNQIQQLDKVKVYFNEEEIEHKTFLQASYDMFEESRIVYRKKGKQNPASAPNKRGPTFISAKMNTYLFTLSAISLVFVLILIGLFCGSLISLMSSFRTFENDKDQIGVLSSAMYQANMFLYSFGFGVIFALEAMMNPSMDPPMLIHNMNPQLQLAENLQLFAELNNRLSNVFLKQEDLDPVVSDILKNRVCPYLEAEIQFFCNIATKEGLNGLMNINAEYLQTSLFYITTFQQNPTIENAMLISGAYINAANPALSTINYAYPFLVNHILGNFHILINDTLKEELNYFLGVCATILLSTIFIYFISIKKLQRADLTRRNILKIIPFNVFQENRILSYYLRLHFSQEVEAIKNIL